MVTRESFAFEDDLVPTLDVGMVEGGHKEV